jgi:hypothetical protein
MKIERCIIESSDTTSAIRVSYMVPYTRQCMPSRLTLTVSLARLYEILLCCSAVGIAGLLIDEPIAGCVLLSQVGEIYRLSSYEVLWYVS